MVKTAKSPKSTCLVIFYIKIIWLTNVNKSQKREIMKSLFIGCRSTSEIFFIILQSNAFPMVDILMCQTQVWLIPLSMAVFPLSPPSVRALLMCMLANWHGPLVYSNGIATLLMSLVTPALLLVWRVKLYGVKKKRVESTPLSIEK